MEVGLVGVYSPAQDARDQISRMAGRLVQIEASTHMGVQTRRLALHVRMAPWIAPPIAHDAVNQACLILLGSAWAGHVQMTAEGLLEKYLSDGETAFTGLGGSFAIVVWQPQTETLRLITDRLGTKKVYLYQSGDTILFATELGALLGHPLVPRRVDEEAVGQFLIASHLLDSRSLIRDVHVLPAATFMRIDHGGQAALRYWTARIVADGNDQPDAWADRLAGVLGPAVRARCAAQPVILPLSGGLDSRAIAAFMPEQAVRHVQACSFGHRHCYDVRYGRRLAKKMGVDYRYLPVPDDFFRRYLDDVLGLCDGEVSIEALPMYRLMDAGQRGQTMLMGYLGDVLSGGHLLDLDPDIGDERAMEVIWQRKYQKMGFSEAMLERVLLPERYREIRGRARDLVRTALAGADAETPDEKALLVELQHRQSRYIAYFGRMLSARYRVEMPFLDLGVLDAFLAMPLSCRSRQGAYRRMLLRHAPVLAAVPEIRTHRPLGHALEAEAWRPAASVPSPLRFPSALDWRLRRVTRFLGKGLVALTGGWLGPHNRDYYVHHDENIRWAGREWYRSQLLDHPSVAEWFDRAALEALFDEHLAGKQDHSIRINNVVSFLAWHRRAMAENS